MGLGGSAGDGNRPRGGPRSPLPAAALALALIVVAAAALPEGLSPSGEGDTGRLVLPSIPTVIRFAIAAMGALMIVTLIVLRVTVLGAEGRPKSKRRSRWRWIALLLVGLVLWATFAAWRQDEITARGEDPGAFATPSPGAPATPADEASPRPEYSESFGAVVGVLLLLAMGALTVALLLLFRREDEEVLGRALETALLEELESGLDDLHRIADPRSAVIACYSRMETVAQLAGVEAAPSDTPFELLVRLLRQVRVSEPSARRLTELFEEAKFSLREIDETMRQEALEALTEVRNELQAEREVVPA